MPSPLDHGEVCVFLDKRRTPDELGGWKTDWVPGIEFPCLIGKAGSIDQLIAERQGNAGVFSITVPRNLPIDFHNVFKSLKTERIYRVTQSPGDNRAPDRASFEVKVGQAEAYTLPKE